jgi:dienelactone hydrolase
MRTFEILLTGLITIAAILLLIGPARHRAALYLDFVAVLLALLAHAVWEGAHWQMAPVYLAVAVFAGLLLFRLPPGAWSSTAAWAMLVAVLLSCGLSAVLPMFRFPRPTGPFAVGTRVMHLVDASRVEDLNPAGGRKRELMIQVWYPAVPSRDPRAPYRRRQETTLLSSYQSVLWTDSRWNAPVTAEGGPFPVLLYSPGWTGRRTSDTFLVEDLASHGYIVVGIDHPYNSGPIAFPDGRVLPPLKSDSMNFYTKSAEQIRATGDAELGRQTADTRFVLDQMQAMAADPNSPFYLRLNAENAGALGFSFGGAVAAQASALDPRIRCALDMDGSLFGEVQREGLPKPFMFLQEDVTHYDANDLSRLSPADRVDKALDDGDNEMFEKYGGYRIVLHGSSHIGFTDAALYSPLRCVSGAGSIPPRREFQIIREYALAFFDKTLKGEQPALLEAQRSPFQGVSVQATLPATK